MAIGFGTVTFYLGTHEPAFMGRTNVPLFVSARRLRRRVSLPKALGPWALDSGAFTEIDKFGRWDTSPQQYADDVQRWAEGIGGMTFAGIQDWMCEPHMLEKTGLSIADHQSLTVESWHTLNALAPDLPWLPTVQGWHADDYLAHVDQYRASGVDLSAAPLVGVGSVCRRQATAELGEVLRPLAWAGLSLHGFGVKTLGLAKHGHLLASSDSLAWSKAARKHDPLPGCAHRNCANCLRYALSWREDVLSQIARPKQLHLL